MKNLFTYCVISLFAIAGLQKATAAEITLRAGHTNAGGSIQDQGIQKLRDLLEAKTNGKATIEIFPNGQIGDEAQLVEGLLLGTLDMAMVSNSIFSNFINDLRVLDMPFMFSDISALSKALEGPAKPMMQASAEASRLQLIGSYSSGIRHMMTKKKISVMEDLAGLKIRTMQQPMHVGAFRAYGANPTPMAYSELYGALQSGVVDGAEGATSDYNAKRFYEVADHFSLVGWLNLTAHIGMSSDKFSSLPKDVQTALLQAGEESAVWQRQYVIDQEQPLLAELKEKGVTIVKPDLVAFKKASMPLYDKFIETDSQRTLFEALNH
jgi:tripartite ATP-independent transporter DctP family solute receptor